MSTNAKTGHKTTSSSLEAIEAKERKRMLRQLDRIEDDLRTALKGIGMSDSQISRETARIQAERDPEERARFALAVRMLGEPTGAAHAKHEPHKLTLGHRITHGLAQPHDREALARRMGVAAPPAEPESTPYKLTLSASRTPRNVH